MILIIAPRAKNVERETREKRGKENLRRKPTEGMRRSAENQFFRNVRSSLTLCSAAMSTKVG